jgi:hypothetical protein
MARVSVNKAYRARPCQMRLLSLRVARNAVFMAFLVFFSPLASRAQAGDEPAQGIRSWLSRVYRQAAGQPRRLHELSRAEIAQFFAPANGVGAENAVIDDRRANALVAFVISSEWDGYDLYWLDWELNRRFRGASFYPSRALAQALSAIFRHDAATGGYQDSLRAFSAFVARSPYSGGGDVYASFASAPFSQQLRVLMSDANGHLRDIGAWKSLVDFYLKSEPSWKVALFVGPETMRIGEDRALRSFGAFLLAEGIRLNVPGGLTENELGALHAAFRPVIEALQAGRYDIYHGARYVSAYAPATRLAHQFFSQSGRLHLAEAFDADPVGTYSVEMAGRFSAILDKRLKPAPTCGGFFTRL